jgi:hypothetical protein
MFKDRTEYLEYRKKKWAAGVIAISWIMHIKMSKVREQLKQKKYHVIFLNNHQILRFKNLSNNWYYIILVVNIGK